MSNNPRARVRKFQKEASVLDKMKWAFSRKGKSEKLLQDLQWFVDTIHKLVPIGLTLQYPLSTMPATELHGITTPPNIQPRVGGTESPPTQVLSRIHQARKNVTRISAAKIRANERQR
ncbi:hypothetical protein BDD12DRAFT_983265 [Trichophaea hybrida]|nr:hypothetical protein BDD12DRAFT_983265 [Trichophaea hybrida]